MIVEKKYPLVSLAFIVSFAISTAQIRVAQAGDLEKVLAVGAVAAAVTYMMKGGKSHRSSGRGVANTEVMKVQESLNLLGFDAGRPDGVSGRRTRQAISQFQASIQNPQTGKLTELQKSVLFKQAEQLVAAGAVGNQPQATTPTTVNTSVATINVGKYPPIDPSSYPKSKKQNPDAVAVIIGNSVYKGDIPPVMYGVRDADAMKALVSTTMGFDSENIIDLRNATLSDLNRVFGVKDREKGDLWRMIDPDGGSDVVVFFAGHGVPDVSSKDAFILPSDGDPLYPATMGYPLSLMYENLGKLKTRSVTVFIDACFSGGSGDGASLIKSASPVFVAAKTPDTSSENINVFTASSGNQFASWDKEEGHGIFTQSLIDGLKGKADLNGDKVITNKELYTYLYKQVRKGARREYGREQVPTFVGNEDAVIVSL